MLIPPSLDLGRQEPAVFSVASVVLSHQPFIKAEQGGEGGVDDGHYGDERDGLTLEAGELRPQDVELGRYASLPLREPRLFLGLLVGRLLVLGVLDLLLVGRPRGVDLLLDFARRRDALFALGYSVCG
ncbi:hypothetical protein [Streptomyces sp. ODS05-4]|uniref:hypothetical protein n=1 Tax=Streptomyces sp. ODS05-4 TaxID=2944939 RepID=UPI00210D9117|nr:hypothetical protein [Streptomyces sp. ODS05-4]